MSGNNNYQNLTFPTNFTNTDYKVICTDFNASIDTELHITTSFCIAGSYITTTSTRICSNRQGIGGFYWVAIGY